LSDRRVLDVIKCNQVQSSAIKCNQSSSTYRLSDRHVLDVGDLRRLRRTDASMHVVNGGRDRAREQAELFGAVEEPLALDYPVREVGRQAE
jgi:hypothetical protein